MRRWDNKYMRQDNLPDYPFKTVKQVLEWVLSLLQVDIAHESVNMHRSELIYT